MADETYHVGDLVELVSHNVVVRIKSAKNDTDHYLATLDIHGTAPPEALGSIIYVHHADIFRRVDEGPNTF